MDNFEKITITAFRKIKSDIDNLKSEIKEIKSSMKELTSLLIKTKEEEDELIKEVEENCQKRSSKKKKR